MRFASNRKLLVIDPDSELRDALREAFRDEQFDVLSAETAELGLQKVRDARPDVVVLDFRLPDSSGLDAFAAIRQLDSRLPVIIVAADATAETAIEATKRGAYDYLLKPVPVTQIRDIVRRAAEISRMSHVPATFEISDDETSSDAMVGQSPRMQAVYKAIGRVAPQGLTVLIRGESGTGKELVARAVYQHSLRAAGPFLAINCAAIPESLLESELFGHERGAFTGAERQRVGKFEQVNGGTLFLDEIGDMSPSTQAKVLRLLQEGTFERVGSNETLRSDVRVIAATHRNLEELVEAGTFRRDLYYRLKVFTIELPPLRERIEDLPSLVEHFLRVARRDIRTSVRAISVEAMSLLQSYRWPGNIRELQSVMKASLVRSMGTVLTPECLAGSFHATDGSFEDSPPPSPSSGIQQLVDELLSRGDEDLHRKIHAEVDRVLLSRVLNEVDGNQLKAAQILGIARSTLRSRIDDLGLSLAKRVLAE